MFSLPNLKMARPDEKSDGRLRLTKIAIPPKHSFEPGDILRSLIVVKDGREKTRINYYQEK